MKTLRSAKFRLAAVVAILTLSAPPPAARADTLYNTTVDYTGVVFVNPCNGELILLSGQLHISAHVSISASGNVTFVMHDNAEGISGIGLTSGLKYQIPGTDNFVEKSTLSGSNVTVSGTDSFHMVAPGPGNNFSAQDSFSYTIDFAAGTFTVNHSEFHATCK